MHDQIAVRDPAPNRSRRNIESFGHGFDGVVLWETTTAVTATIGAPAHSGAPFPLSAAQTVALDPNLASHSASAAGVIRRSFAISSTRGAKPRARNL
jgi:hypothetical protein